MKEKNPKRASIDSVVWLVVLTLMKIYNEKEQAEKERMFAEEMSTRKWNTVKFHVQSYKHIKK